MTAIGTRLSKERCTCLDNRGLNIVIEVLSHGKANEQRDRKAKLKLYSRRGVQEYWIVSWIEQFVEIYRRDDAELKLAANQNAQAELESSLLPGFSCQVAKLFLSSRPA